MKQLPEKWAIKTDDPEFYEWLNSVKYFDDVESDVHLSDCYIHYEPYPEKKWVGLDILKEGHELITIEQWREAVKLEVNYGWKIEPTGELEGYEAPYDIPFWDLKEGDIFIEHGKELDFYSNGSVIPKQVVRSWKPVYKAKEKKRVPKSFVDVYENGRLWGAFPDKKEAVQRVKEKGKVGCKYTYQEVDYITEE